MKFCENDNGVVKMVLESQHCSKQLVQQYSINNNTNCALLACQYSYNSAKLILESPYCDTTLLEYCDEDNFNSIMLACYYNLKVAPLILESSHCSEKMLLQCNKDGCNSLMLACYHDISMVPHILESPFCTLAVLSQLSKSGFNGLMKICQWCPEHIQALLNCKSYDSSLLNCKTTKANMNKIPVRLSRNQIVSNYSCLHILAIYHPASIKEYSLLFPSLIDEEDSNGNKFYSYLLPEYENVLQEFFDKDSVEYRKYIKQSKVHGITDTICGICLQNEYTHVFTCGHCTCGPCSKRINECHLCKKTITHKIKIYL